MSCRSLDCVCSATTCYGKWIASSPVVYDSTKDHQTDEQATDYVDGHQWCSTWLGIANCLRLSTIIVTAKHPYAEIVIIFESGGRLHIEALVGVAALQLAA